MAVPSVSFHDIQPTKRRLPSALIGKGMCEGGGPMSAHEPA